LGMYDEYQMKRTDPHPAKSSFQTAWASRFVVELTLRALRAVERELRRFRRW
jgi:hypothetical protein